MPYLVYISVNLFIFFNNSVQFSDSETPTVRPALSVSESWWWGLFSVVYNGDQLLTYPENTNSETCMYNRHLDMASIYIILNIGSDGKAEDFAFPKDFPNYINTVTC